MMNAVLITDWIPAKIQMDSHIAANPAAKNQRSTSIQKIRNARMLVTSLTSTNAMVRVKSLINALILPARKIAAIRTMDSYIAQSTENVPRLKIAVMSPRKSGVLLPMLA